MKSIRPAPRILIVLGVTLDQLLMTSEIELNPSGPEFETELMQTFSEIPKRFTGVSNWPKSTNLLCWECGFQFTSYPKFVPINPCRGENGEDECDVEGNFCEWSCVLREIKTQYPPNQQSDLIAFVDIFRAKWPSEPKRKLFPGPRKTKMKIYCGNQGLTTEQWKAEVAEINLKYPIHPHKMLQLNINT